MKNQQESWSGRGDSNPRLQLGKLSYYPYTTAAYLTKLKNPEQKPEASAARSRLRTMSCSQPSLYSMPTKEGQGRALESLLEGQTTRRAKSSLVDFSDASALDDGGSFLPRGEFGRFFAINIDAREFLAILIKDGDLPVAMLAPAVAAKPRTALHF
jgi:hypothetical protein